MLLCFFFLFGLLGPLRGSAAEKKTNLVEDANYAVRDEVEAISTLIDEQRRGLQKKSELRERMLLFRKQKDAFTSGHQTQKDARDMISSARDILEDINKEHIAHLFSEQYLEELVFFSSIAAKSKAARP